MKKNLKLFCIVLIVCLTFGLLFSSSQTTIFALQTIPKAYENQTQTVEKNNNTNTIKNDSQNKTSEKKNNTENNTTINDKTTLEKTENNTLENNKESNEITDNSEKESGVNNKTEKDNATQNKTQTIENENKESTKLENKNKLENKTTTNNKSNAKNNTTLNTDENLNKESGENKTETLTICDDCKIKVMCEGKIYIKPDTAKIRFAINTLGENIEEIEKQNTQSMNDIITKLTELNISKENIKSLSYTMIKKYDYKDGEQIYLGQEISNNLEIITKDLEKITSIISALNENGVTEIYSVNLSLENKTTAYNDALKNALENAKTKASILSGNKEICICKVMECPENHASMLKTTTLDAKSLNTDNYTEILQNEICVKAYVLVEFCVA